MSRTLPKEVSEKIEALHHMLRRFGMDMAEERVALESAILAYGDAAREGALREALPVVSAFDGLWSRYQYVTKAANLCGEMNRLRLAVESLRALGSRPEPEPVKRREPRPGEIDAYYRSLAAEPAPESGERCDPDCRDGRHVIGCPKRPPAPPCTCKMPIGFGRSFRGFMAPDPNCAFCHPRPAPHSKEDEG